MKRYKRKPLFANAVQWNNDVEIEGLKILPIQIAYSLTGDYYTILDPAIQANHWFSTQTFDETYVTENRHQYDFVKYDRPDESYYRRAVAIGYSLVQPGGLTQDVSSFDPLYQDVAIAYNWPLNRIHFIGEYKGSMLHLMKGTWILEILDGNGETLNIATSDDEDFSQTFEESENVIIA